MAELFLSNKAKIRNFHSRKLFTYHLNAISDGGEFGRTYAEIYPK